MPARGPASTGALPLIAIFLAVAFRPGAAISYPLTSDEFDSIRPGTIERAVPRPSRQARETAIAEAQIILDRLGLSPGVIDGLRSKRFENALKAFAEQKGLASATVEDLLAAGEGERDDLFAEYVITREDLKGPFLDSVPRLFVDQAKLDRVGYTSPREALAERFHMDEAFLAELNPDADFEKAGTVIRVANPGKPLERRVERIVASKSRKTVRAFGASGELVAAYPASVGSDETPTPAGMLQVVNTAGNPAYTFRPDFRFQTGTATGQVLVPPGPNNPVGSAWIGLSKPTYGIHGTAEPSQIGESQSHGCIRLTNWDAYELARLVRRGVPVEITE